MESLEDFLQRVFTITMDGFEKAEASTLQQIAKDAAMTVMNESVAIIQDACRRIKTIIVNKKTIGGDKVAFQERVCTIDEETRVSNIEQKINDLAKTLQNGTPSNRSPSPSMYDPLGQGRNWPRQRSPVYYRDVSQEVHTQLHLNIEASRLPDYHTKTFLNTEASHQSGKDLHAIMPTVVSLDKGALVGICHIDHRTGIDTLHQCLGIPACPVIHHLHPIIPQRGIFQHLPGFLEKRRSLKGKVGHPKEMMAKRPCRTGVKDPRICR